MTRTGFRLNRRALFGMMVLAALGALPVQAATLVAVPTAADGVLGDSACSLREAVMQINAGVNSNDCVDVSGVAYGTNDTIRLQEGTYNLSATGLDETWQGTLPNFAVVNTPDASKGDLDLQRSVRIVGAGADRTVIQWDSAVPEVERDRIFHVFTLNLTTVSVAIEGVTIQGGRTFEDFIEFGADDPASPGVALTEYYLRRAGGGIAVGPSANVVLIDPAVEGDENAAGRGGSQRPNEPNVGGATFSLALTGVKVLSNQAQGDGAGIYTASPMTLSGVVVSANVSTVNGGGIYNEGNSEVTATTISGNQAEGGGGMFLTGSNTVTISGTTLSGNRAVGGGAISGRADVTVNMVNSTISGNLGEDVGAGLYTNGAASLRFVTIANNFTGAESITSGSGVNVFPSGAVTVTLRNVILSGNKRGWEFATYPDPADDPTLFDANCGYTGSSMAITSNGHNLSSDLTCTTLTETTDRRNIDPKIGELADNGGPTFTHALLNDSPALSAGTPEAGITTDQRGQPREIPPDIGAFELDNIGGGGGGCAVGGEGRLDPTLPAMLAAALAFFGWRRRAGK
jgi:hypothetical protein